MLKDFKKRPLTSRLMLSFGLLVVLGIVSQGCYTMIKHPKVEEAELHAEEAGTRCLECHTNLAEYPFGYDPVGFPHYWDYWENYELYYTYPWWWEDYFWDTGSGSSGAVYREPVEPPERRRGIKVPYPDYDPPPAGITPPGSGSGGSGGQASGTKDGKYRGDDKSDDKNSGDKKDSGSGKKEKPERRRTPK